MLNPLDTHFKMVATNTRTFSIQEAVSKAKVILFCERHLQPKYQNANAMALNSFWTPETRFFVEGPVESHVPSARAEIKNSAVSWQNEEEISKIFSSSFDNILKVFESFIMLIHFLEVVDLYLSDQTIEINKDLLNPKIMDGKSVEELPTAPNELNKFALLYSMKSLKDHEVFASVSVPDQGTFESKDIDSLLKTLVSAWQTFYTKSVEKTCDLVDEVAIERNNMLIQSLLKANQEGVSKIVGIAGTSHLKPPNDGKFVSINLLQSILNLYKALKDADIPYVTLKATNRYQTEETPQVVENGKRHMEEGEEPQRKRREINPENEQPESESFIKRASRMAGEVQEINDWSSIALVSKAWEFNISIMTPIQEHGIDVFKKDFV